MASSKSPASIITSPSSEHCADQCQRHICVPDVSNIPSLNNTRFAELLDTRIPPETADLPSLKAGLHSARAISAAIDEAIAATQLALEELQSAKTTATTAIVQHLTILDLFNSVPDDILFTIFQWSTSSDKKGIDSLSSSRAPWTLSQVCRRWRTLAISSPCLWSDMDITARSIDTPHAKGMFTSKLDLRLLRSAEYPLHVTLSAHMRNDDVFIDECFPLIQPTLHRWKTLNLAIHDAAFALQAASCRYQILEQLHLKFWDTVPGDLPSTWDTPNIRSLTLSGWPSGDVDIPWERITNYTCDENGICNLTHLVALEDLSLDVIIIERALGRLNESAISLPLSLPTVHSISMWQQYKCQDISLLSACFTLPSLTTLTLKMGPSGWLFPTFNDSILHVQNLTMFFVRVSSSSTVKPIDKKNIKSFLANCPSVTALYLPMDQSEEEVVEALLDETALPKLTSLRIAIQTMWNHPEGIVKLLEARCEEGNVARIAELRIVEIDNAPPPEGDWMEAILATEDVLKRWRAVCQKVDVLNVFDNVF